jgi:tRNA pseudouridine55 synthase
MATGVLVLGFDRATRLLGHLALHDKAYDATIRLGASTVTDDAEGEVLEVASRQALSAVTDARIGEALAAMLGRIRQRPSAVSAIKVDGRRAYARVRDGEEVVLPDREVEITTLEVRDVRRTTDSIDVDISVVCSSGTYIRSIARDLGQMVGVGGHLTALRRTRVGPFSLAESVPIDLIPEGVRSIDDVSRRCFPVLELGPEAEADARHGRPMDWPASDTALPEQATHALMGAGGVLIALAEPEGMRLRYVAVLAPD